MKIGILGGPGSGKTRLARKLATSLGKEVFEGTKPKIIDGYVEKLEKDTNLAFGYFATLPQNLQILFHRWTLEQSAQSKGLNTITCGTMYETTIYCAILANKASMSPDEDIEFLQGRAAMTALGMIESLIYDYDILLYLPYDGKTLLEKGQSYDTVIDRKIPEVLGGYFKGAAILDGTERDNAKYATSLVKTIREEQKAAENDEQSIRGSRKASPRKSKGK